MDEEILKKYTKAGEIAAQALQKAKEMVAEGVTLVSVADAAESYIKEQGAGIGFPINISINEFAAHYTPVPRDPLVFEKGQVVKLDLGVHVDGCLADTATTVEVGDNKYEKMILSSQDALNKALTMIKPGVRIADIGEAIESVIKDAGFRPIVNLTGHTMEPWNLHAGKSVYNVKKDIDDVLEEGEIVAIEPFSTDGSGRVVNSKSSDIYKLLVPKQVRMRQGRQILMEIVTNHKTLPFAKRWFVEKFGVAQTSMALRQLVNWGVLHQYPILKDQENGIVTQAEHTVIVSENPVITTKLS